MLFVGKLAGEEGGMSKGTQETEHICQESIKY